MNRQVLLTLSLVLFSFLSVTAQNARLQIIHNCPDLAAEKVDVWVGNNLLLDNFEFRTSTPFIDVPANTPLEIRVKDSTSTDTTNPMFFQTVTLAANESYVAIANGIISPTGYSNSPAFNLAVYTPGRETAEFSGDVDIIVFHGSPDAPTIDVEEVGVGAGAVIDNLNYGTYNQGGYTAFVPADYTLRLLDETSTVGVREYDAPLASLGLTDSALVVMASGFLDPSVNSNGPAFGLYVALPGGGPLLSLPEVQGRAQIIHNSADMAASTVDAYVVGPAGEQIAKVDDFDFRTATPFVDLPANVELSLVIADQGSTDASNPIYDETVQLARDENYIVTAHGIASPNGYTPGAGQTPLAFSVFGGARTAASQAGNTDVLVFHGATDAPIVDVYETAVNNPEALVVDNLAYGDYINQYLELPTDDYALDVRDENNTTTVQGYQAPLSTLALTDQSITVLASGFLDPAENSNGDAFGLWAALADGGDLVELPLVTSIGEELTAEKLSVFPNPSAGLVTFRSENISAGTQIIISDITGKTIKSLTWNSGNRMQVNLNDQSKGTYFYQLRNDESTITGKLIIVK